ncbi:uncharacterized protein EI90DRAFT_2910894, partial [Cantharellus anzutake]|uniref:uncharacterized protein n=1 Tax=Cantharellus anzutake TaxID=1750568 RepID=UPI00190657D9
ESVIDLLQRQKAELQELLRDMSDSWRTESARQHQETLGAVRATANEQVPFNVQGYLDDFSKALSAEVRMLLKEVGKLREEKRALQHELGMLLCMKSKYSPGGEFEPDWWVTTLATVSSMVQMIRSVGNHQEEPLVGSHKPLSSKRLQF